MKSTGEVEPPKPRQWDDIAFVPLERAHIADVRRLHEELFPVRYRDAFYENLFNHNVRATVAVRRADSRVVAIATVRITDGPSFWDSLLDRKQAYVMTIGVTRELRRRGLGSAMLRYMDEMLAAAGEAQTLCLHVQASNEAAIEFYRGHGFETVSKEIGYYTFDSSDPVDGDHCPDAFFLRIPVGRCSSTALASENVSFMSRVRAVMSTVFCP